MDLYASAALSGLGYALNKERDALKRGIVSPPPSDIPSMKSVYNSDYWTSVRADERSRGESKWNQSASPFETGVVSRPAYASSFSGIDERAAANKPQSIETLAGTTLPVGDFVHNNMEPFFRGTVKQNTDPYINETRLERMTGRGDLYMHKKEVECFFEPTAGFANVCGMADNSDFYMERTMNTRARNNDVPFEQVRVGKGLGLGFTSEPSGGFHQGNTLDYARPKNVDELRVATKPRLVHELPIQGPKQGIAQRGFIGEVSKNRPETAYEQTPDMLLRTKGAVTKEMGRPVIDLKPTARVEGNVEYIGVANNGVVAGKGEYDDLGKSSIHVYNNERQTTQNESIITNITSAVKSIIAPLLDVFRHSTKEYNVDAARTFGNMQAQIPEKPTTYDPVNHAMRTTIKETLIHDTTINNLKGPERVTAALADSAKTTVRQTMPVQETTRNVSATTYRVTVYNVDAVAKTTVRETTPASGSQLGFIGGAVTEGTGAYDYVKVELDPTQKQFISDYQYEGVATSKSDFRAVSDEAQRNAEIDGTREALNVAAGHTPNGAGGFTSLDPSNIDLAARKLVSDSMAARTVGNVSRVVQSQPPYVSACDITKPAMPMLNAAADRLDTAVLGGLRSNPFAISVNPI